MWSFVILFPFWYVWTKKNLQIYTCALSFTEISETMTHMACPPIFFQIMSHLEEKPHFDRANSNLTASQISLNGTNQIE
jgi:hypothetical protein